VSNHLIFYDGSCPLCHRAVRFILNQDKQTIFQFAPLKGKTAKRELKELFLEKPALDSLVLLQNYGTDKEKVRIEADAFFKILWLLQGKWIPLGFLSFLPACLFNPIYRLVAKYRYRLFKTPKLDLGKTYADRFLP